MLTFLAFLTFFLLLYLYGVGTIDLFIFVMLFMIYSITLISISTFMLTRGKYAENPALTLDSISCIVAIVIFTLMMVILFLS